VTYQRCDEAQIRQVSFPDNCTMTSCDVIVEPSDPAGSSYIGHVFSVSNYVQSFVSNDATAFTGELLLLEGLISQVNCFEKS